MQWRSHCQDGSNLCGEYESAMFELIICIKYREWLLWDVSAARNIANMQSFIQSVWQSCTMYIVIWSNLNWSVWMQLPKFSAYWPKLNANLSHLSHTWDDAPSLHHGSDLNIPYWRQLTENNYVVAFRKMYVIGVVHIHILIINRKHR